VRDARQADPRRGQLTRRAVPSPAKKVVQLCPLVNEDLFPVTDEPDVVEYPDAAWWWRPALAPEERSAGPTYSFAFGDPATWGQPDTVTETTTRLCGPALIRAWTGCTPG
jgi:hypothetical protein